MYRGSQFNPQKGNLMLFPRKVNKLSSQAWNNQKSKITLLKPLVDLTKNDGYPDFQEEEKILHTGDKASLNQCG